MDIKIVLLFKLKNNIVALRPKIGIESNKFFKIVGKRAKKNIKINAPIFMKDLR